MRLLLKRSKRQERKTAKELGGKRVPLSGAHWTAKGDVSAEKELVECKQTSRKSYTLSAAVLEKILHEAYRAAKRPVLQVQFTHGKGGRYAIIPWTDYLALRGEE